ncbi:MAG: hypothetical protein M1828_001828 [Chrysothrix sp. TS-e1954]|nr:MAG: hypothetical protein M1828_001828 [Chrysothrix sp. TS-e1954]
MPAYYPIHPLAHQPYGSSDMDPQDINSYYDGGYERSDSYASTDIYGAYNNTGSHDMPIQGADPYSQYQQSQSGPPQSMYDYNSAYNSMGAPMLASLPIDQRQFEYGARQQPAAYSEVEAHDEKPRGGVSQTLDYDIDQMTNFVTEMSVGMYELYVSRICIADIDLIRSVKPGVQVSPKFRDWTKAVLAATRLPSATILMSLSYMALRIRGLSAAGSFSPPVHGLHQMLTVALVLGSKFLDDNTFQNKSWADVSLVPVKELNLEERDWLECFDHRLHNDPASSDGYDSWQQQWFNYKTRAMTNSAALRPIDTNVRNQQSASALSSMRYQPSFNHLGNSGRLGCNYNHQSYSPLDAWFGSRSERSPPTATTTGPTTPEFYAGHNAFTGHFGGYAHQGYSNYPPAAPRSSYYHAGYPTPPYSYWNTHGAACQCQSCRNMHHFLPNQFGQIAVR